MLVAGVSRSPIPPSPTKARRTIPGWKSDVEPRPIPRGSKHQSRLLWTEAVFAVSDGAASRLPCRFARMESGGHRRSPKLELTILEHEEHFGLIIGHAEFPAPTADCLASLIRLNDRGVDVALAADGGGVAEGGGGGFGCSGEI